MVRLSLVCFKNYPGHVRIIHCLLRKRLLFMSLSSGLVVRKATFLFSFVCISARVFFLFLFFFFSFFFFFFFNFFGEFYINRKWTLVSSSSTLIPRNYQKFDGCYTGFKIVSVIMMHRIEIFADSRIRPNKFKDNWISFVHFRTTWKKFNKKKKISFELFYTRLLTDIM